MIRHIVMFRLKDEFTGDLRKQKAMEMKAELDQMNRNMGFPKRFETGLNFNNTAAAWDIVLISDFETPEELQNYQEHPEHKKFIAFNKNYSKEKAVADFEF